MIYEVVASSGGVGPDSGGGAGLEAKDEGPPVEARARADVRLPTLLDIACEGPRCFPLYLVGCCYSNCMAAHTVKSMGTVGRMSCAYLAVGESESGSDRAPRGERARRGRGAEPLRAAAATSPQVRVRGERDAVALSRRAWRPSAVDSLFQYRDALNDHLRAT